MTSAETMPAKQSVRATARTSHGADLVLATSVLLAAAGHLLIKHGLNAATPLSGVPIVSRLVAYLLMSSVIAGLAIYGSGTLLWIVAVTKRDISYLYPVTAVNYIIVTLGGLWMFGEPVSPGRWGGILTVVIGVAILHSSRKEQRS